MTDTEQTDMDGINPSVSTLTVLDPNISGPHPTAEANAFRVMMDEFGWGDEQESGDLERSQVLAR